MTTKKILIPLDGSAFSYEILPYIQTFFRPTDYELTILHLLVQEKQINIKNASYPPERFCQFGTSISLKYAEIACSLFSLSATSLV